jgi:hypothetical protein
LLLQIHIIEPTALPDEVIHDMGCYDNENPGLFIEVLDAVAHEMGCYNNMWRESVSKSTDAVALLVATTTRTEDLVTQILFW